jgi:archaellum component FlaC
MKRDIGEVCDCYPKVKKDLTDLQQEFTKLKEEMQELCVQKAVISDERQRHEQEICDVKHEVELLRQTSDSQRESQERETRAVAEVQKVVGQLTKQLEDLRTENGHDRLAAGKVALANEQLRADATGLKHRMEVLEQENRQLSTTNEVMKRDIGEVCDCYPKVKKDLTDLQQEFTKLKDEIKAVKREPEPLAPPAADVAVQPGAKATDPAQKSSNNPSPPDTPPPRPRIPPVKVSPPPAPPTRPPTVEPPPKQAKQFPPSMKKGKLRRSDGSETSGMHDIPEGIVAHLTRECGGKVHDCPVVEVTCGSLEKETQGANPHSGAYGDHPDNAAKNAVDLETDSVFMSAYRSRFEDIPHTRNNWVCYGFKERRIVPTHYAIRTNGYDGPDGLHLKSWLVETSADGENWREVAREENNGQLNGFFSTATFAVASGGECRFIRLVNIGKNHFGDDCLSITAWEIFGRLFE